MTLGKFEQALFIIVALLWLNACDTVVNSENTANHEIETVSIDQGNDDRFTIHLDPSIVPARRFFDDIDDLHHFMDSIDASGQVSLNKNLYLRLKHALYPNEIAALDMEGVAIVGEYKYVVSEEVVSRKNIGNSDTELEIETYHGKSGYAYLDEFATLARNINDIDELKDFTFRDPDIMSLYVSEKNKVSPKVSNIVRKRYGPVGSDKFPFDDPETGQYTIAFSGMHDRGYIFWNQSIGRFRRRAIAHTSLLFRPQGWRKNRLAY